MRLGPDGNRWLDYCEVQETLGISRERARQLKSKLRHQLIGGRGFAGGREMVFLEDDVLEYKASRKPGRPRLADSRSLDIAPPMEELETTVAGLRIEVKLLSDQVSSLASQLLEVSSRLAALDKQTEGSLIVRIPRRKDPRS